MFEFVDNFGRFPQVPWLRELGLLDVGGLEVLRCAQDDSQRDCHPEPIRCAQGKLREGSHARMGITRVKCLDNPPFPCYDSAN